LTDKNPEARPAAISKLNALLPRPRDKKEEDDDDEDSILSSQMLPGIRAFRERISSCA
jgi:hypothetical protein